MMLDLAIGVDKIVMGLANDRRRHSVVQPGFDVQMKPFGFQWHITNYCNLRCKHCYQNEFTKKEDLDTETTKLIIKKIADALKDRKLSINITGGEPVLREDIFEILEYISLFNNIKELYIITNAIPLDKNRINKLKKLSKLKALKISLEGSHPEINDSLRGKATFKKVLQNIELLKKSSMDIILMFTLGSYNYHDLVQMLQFSKSSEAAAVIIERFVPLGQGQALKDCYLKRNEWLDVIKWVISYYGLDVSPHDLLPYKAFWIELKNEKEVKGALCNLGDESMALMPNGDIYPCRRLPTKIGNILKDDFNEILLRLKILRESFDKNLKGRCHDCVIPGCIGCRANAYSLTDDFYAEDQQCFLDLLALPLEN